MGQTSIYCSYQTNAQWHDDTTSKPGINIYRVRISHHLPNIRTYLSVLTEDELRRSRNYHHQKDTDRFIISRGVLRLILADKLSLSPKEIRFGKGENKKPFIENTGTDRLEFNVTHSGDWIIIAISSQPVGADIECIDPDFEYAEIMAFAFHKQEIDYINDSGCPRNKFFLLWSRKESLLKATGKGIGNHLSSTLCLDGNNYVTTDDIGSVLSWNINTFLIEEDYVVNVAFAVDHEMNFHTVGPNCFNGTVE